MYNLDAYIADFLSDHKKLSAQGIGEFTIVDGQAGNGAPLVNFVSSKAAYTSEELISFIAEHQGKNKIVTGFDVESHLNQIKQFINIGTPWIIPGFGQLQLGKNRELEFVQEVQGEHALQERIKHKQSASEAHYQTYDAINPATQRSSNTSTIALTLIIILALGAGGYYFYTNNKNATSAMATKDIAATVTDTVVEVPSSSNINNTVTNTQPPAASTAKAPDNVVTASPKVSTISTTANGFHFVLNTTTNAEYAHKRYVQLKAYGTQVFIDSVKHDSYSVYKIYLVNNASPADTTKLRDSLTRYYGKPVKIEAGQ